MVEEMFIRGNNVNLNLNDMGFMWSLSIIRELIGIWRYWWENEPIDNYIITRK